MKKEQPRSKKKPGPVSRDLRPWSIRLPAWLIEAIEADADKRDSIPTRVAREILEKHYGRKTNGRVSARSAAF